MMTVNNEGLAQRSKNGVSLCLNQKKYLKRKICRHLNYVDTLNIYAQRYAKI